MEPTTAELPTLDEIRIRYRIESLLRSYCRGVDRLDPECIRAAFHPDAGLLDYGPDPMTVEGFVDRVMTSLATKYSSTQHRIANITIDIDQAAGRALGETYVLASHVQSTDDGELLHTFCGRYIDQIENRGGLWRIAKRTIRNDWSTVEPMTRMRGQWVTSGRGGSPDPLFDN